MPLSEDEERILHEIERRFYANDPERARRISDSTLPRYLARNCRRSLAGFFVGLVVLLVALATTWVIGIVGLALMLFSAVTLVQNLRRMGRHGWQAVRAATRSAPAESWPEMVERIRRRWRGR